MKTEVLVDGSM